MNTKSFSEAWPQISASVSVWQADIDDMQHLRSEVFG